MMTPTLTPGPTCATPPAARVVAVVARVAPVEAEVAQAVQLLGEAVQLVGQAVVALGPLHVQLGPLHVRDGRAQRLGRHGSRYVAVLTRGRARRRRLLHERQEHVPAQLLGDVGLQVRLHEQAEALVVDRLEK